MASNQVKFKCPSCGASCDAPGAGDYRCWKCDGRLKVESRQSTRPKMPVLETGFIPWSALDSDERQVFHDGGRRLASGRGPGAALSGVTKRLGVKPCQGCFRRAAALNQLGWPVVGGYTVAVLAVGVGLSRWFLF